MEMDRIHSGEPVVFVVAADLEIRTIVHELAQGIRMSLIACGSASEYLAIPQTNRPGCLILEVELPDISGLDLQLRIADRHHPPIIFVSGKNDVSASVRAIKAGAVEFLMKPCSRPDLVAAMAIAVAQDRRVCRDRIELAQLRRRHSSLTPREQEVLPLIVGGFLNKQAAAQLGISETTLQIHRRRVLRKMQAQSLAHLVRMAAQLSIPPLSPEPHPAGRSVHATLFGLNPRQRRRALLRECPQTFVDELECFRVAALDVDRRLQR